MVCILCKSGWEILDDEKYCGWCGSPTKGFSIHFDDEEQINYADSENEIELIYTIINTGILPITVDRPQISIE
ncbi:MAG: hypothetical protein NTX65_14895 [Ignavibacteriales bacterium]|nr:hypothetical protein [Ignavibacteriales bacterium]